MKCCLCGNEIEVVRGWGEGNNAQPIAEGRCCDKCNDTKVIPRRIEEMNMQKRLADMGVK